MGPIENTWKRFSERLLKEGGPMDDWDEKARSAFMEIATGCYTVGAMEGLRAVVGSSSPVEAAEDMLFLSKTMESWKSEESEPVLDPLIHRF